MKRVIFFCWISAILLFSMNPPSSFCQEHEKHHKQEEMANISYGNDINSLIDEFMNTGEAIEGQPGGEQPVYFEGGSKPNYYQGLRVTRSNNPMLEDDCKKQATEFAVNAIGEFEGHDEHEKNEAMRAAAIHMAEHMEFIQNNQISYAEYMQEISECKEFCGPLIANLIKCHVVSVARHEHDIILFNLDSDYVASEYADGVINEIARKIKQSPGKKVALYGRASLIGDLLYNRMLSRKRALAVKDKLVKKGVPSSNIETMFFGWEPPQISDWIADEYGLEHIYHEKGKKKINQSVMAVLY